MIRVKGGVSYRGTQTDAITEKPDGHWLKPSAEGDIIIYVPEKEAEKVYRPMKNILVFLMPYAGHFFTNVALIRYLASKGINLMIYGDSRFACLLPAGNIAWRDYPEKIAEYCQNGHTFQHDRNRAAYDYFSYMTDSRKNPFKRTDRLRYEEILLRAISRESVNFVPISYCMTLMHALLLLSEKACHAPDRNKFICICSGYMA